MALFPTCKSHIS